MPSGIRQEGKIRGGIENSECGMVNGEWAYAIDFSLAQVTFCI